MRIDSVSRFVFGLIGLCTCIVLSGMLVACENGGGTCKDGQVVGCTCATQAAGSQVCSAGSWTACNCSQGSCQDGAVVACTCGTQTGSQSCTAGAWSACNCVSGSCQDGSQLACQCGTSGAGSQTCSGGTWSSCQGCQTVTPPGGDCTTPGQSEACTCTDGNAGTRSCGQDKKWATCQCSGNPTCTSGQSEACTCTDGRTGSRVCDASGSWGACTCQAKAPCVDGDTQPCGCAGGKQGTQTCVKTGDTFAWGTCGNCKEPTELCTKPGDSKRCFCSNGGASWKTCGNDKVWGKCDCGEACTLGDVRKNDCDCSSGFRGDNKCVEGPSGSPEYQCQCSCQAGETRACECPNSQTGKVTCKNDNTWTACACPKCKTDADCASQATAKFCDTTTEACVECTKSDQCNGKLCAPATTSCVECITDADCGGKAAATCYPLDYTCKQFGRGTLTGVLRRCQDTAGAGQCRGNQPRGDDKGRIYFLFFTGKRLPPSYQEKPFMVYKTDVIDFKDPTKTVPYKVENVPEGNWLVYVFIDDNNNWSPGQHMPDPGDLVGFIKGVQVTANKEANVDFSLTDRQ